MNAESNRNNSNGTTDGAAALRRVSPLDVESLHSILQSPDVYRYLYKKSRLLPPSYLYNPNNNIKLGTAYLRLIYSKYLKDIKDPTSRLYCTIAAYNT